MKMKYKVREDGTAGVPSSFALGYIMKYIRDEEL